MSGFSPEWLALREPVDHRSRNAELASSLSARFQQRSTVEVVDLGCGTGSNLRATVPLLPDIQSWTLVDYDERLLAAARQTLLRWADSSRADGERLILVKGNRQITVQFGQADLNAALDVALGDKPDLITASALFDLCSVDFIKAFARAVARRGAVFYTVLTYNGIQRWTPRQPSDGAMMAAFHAHQTTDKGFGLSAGPMAPAHLADAFRVSDYNVLEGESPWMLGAKDQTLVTELASGFAGAVRETGAVDAKSIETWAKVMRTGAEVGHTDTLAFPS
ncbi:MAG: class I SAM-dependent methyltransferase [Hyphomicrobiaceae bacterium]